MDTPTLIAVIALVVVVLLLVALGLAAARKRRSAALREEFGPEYDRALDDTGKRRDAEKDLAARKDEHDQLELRPLTPAARERYTASWTAAQARFVDAPAQALNEADALVTQLMAERGYPTDDFDSRTRLLSVEHAHVLDDYRSAHEVELASRARTADTESVRNAMLDFRRVFEDLMAVDEGEPYPQETPGTRARSER
jgi:hypothetical protein